ADERLGRWSGREIADVVYYSDIFEVWPLGAEGDADGVLVDFVVADEDIRRAFVDVQPGLVVEAIVGEDDMAGVPGAEFCGRHGILPRGGAKSDPVMKGAVGDVGIFADAEGEGFLAVGVGEVVLVQKQVMEADLVGADVVFLLAVAEGTAEDDHVCSVKPDAVGSYFGGNGTPLHQQSAG